MADPYTVLGVSPRATDAEIRAAYRTLVKRHHPDHNNGSPESEQRFEAVQEAYAEIQRRRRGGAPHRAPPAHTAPHRPVRPEDPDVEARLADLEQQVREARLARVRAEQAEREARERMRQAARDAAAAAGRHSGDAERPGDEELGYINTDDTIWKILSDARDQLADRFAEAREQPLGEKVNDLIDAIERLGEKVDPRRKR